MVLLTFRYSDDNQRDRDDENLHELDALLIRRLVVIIILPKLDEEPDHECDEEYRTGGAAELGY